MSNTRLTHEEKNILKKSISFEFRLISIYYKSFFKIILFLSLMMVLSSFFIKLNFTFLNGLYIFLGVLFLLFLITYENLWKIAKVYLDINNDKKISTKILDFELITNEEVSFIKDNMNGSLFKINEDLIPFIKTNLPLEIKMATISKQIIFLSQEDGKNIILTAEILKT
ncbi:hypothetical protein ACFPVY_11045 [Flavobacterium qiangtangense]|uniref:Uncharacterized protein n=1 Tax=Flavobacterium qiangtangense TaxID=1442595 RepID=A0ABW1PNI1_9FLAO